MYTIQGRYIIKTILKFNEEEINEAKMAMHSANYYMIITEIWERLFRGNNKHGYHSDLLNKESSYEVIEELSKMYRDILEENNFDRNL